ncbi:hypothetical protein ACP3V3_14000 [Vibrio sp. PNB22_3_1]
MKKIILCNALFFCNAALAGTEIRSSTGASCEQSDFQPWELSVGAGKGDYFNSNQYSNSTYIGDVQQDETQLGMKVTYRFGGAEQIDCARFQTIVEREQEAHTKQLEMKLVQLQQQLAKQQQIINQSSKVKFRD